MKITETVEGLERYPVNVRYDRDFRSDLDALKRVLVPAAGNRHIPLAQIATITVRNDPDSIKSENARRTAWVYVDIHGTDLGSYVESAQQAVSERVKLPQGYNIVWSGQFEYMQKAKQRLIVIIPLTVLIIFVIIYLNTRSLVKTSYNFV